MHRIPPRLLLCLLLLAAAPAAAVPGSSGCTDLSSFPEQPRVDFQAQVQPLFTNCSGCHGSNGSAGLDLRPGRAYDSLVGVTATTNPAVLRVQPGDPDASLLLSAVNCTTTGGPSFQMPGLNPEQRALIRDWIAQGALRAAPPRAIPVLSPWALVLLALALGAGALAARRAGTPRRD